MRIVSISGSTLFSCGNRQDRHSPGSTWSRALKGRVSLLNPPTPIIFELLTGKYPTALLGLARKVKCESKVKSKKGAK